jgi:hypothetical protein
MVTNDVRGTRKIKSRIAVENAILNKKKTLFTRKLKILEEPSEMLYLEHSFYGA